MRFIKKVRKIFSVIHRGFIKQLAYIDSNFYTAKYTKYLKKCGMKIDGQPRYISPTAVFDGNDYSIIHLGDFCVISSDVQLLTHDYSIARGLQAIGKNNSNPLKDELFLNGISVGANTFIGARSILLPGTIIGDNCIIGAGSVVKGHIKDNSIVFGNPAKFYADTKEWAMKKYEEKKYFVEK